MHPDNSFYETRCSPQNEIAQFVGELVEEESTFKYIHAKEVTAQVLNMLLLANLY
jgi:hypothetical protein